MKNFHRAVASFFFVIISVFAFADWSSVEKDFHKAGSHDQAVAKLKNSEQGKDAAILELLDDYGSATTKEAKESTFNSIKQFVTASALSEHFSVSKDADAKAKQVKQEPLYKTQKEAASSNWIQKLWDRFTRTLENNNQAAAKMPQIPAWVADVVRGLFVLLCLAIIAALIYLIVQIPWSWTKAGKAKRAKKGGMLEEGELLLSEDEYLIEADRLIAEGRFREACRALYLATLLRIDKARIARFESAQTNWEHLRRIEVSQAKPETFEFRPATKAFDLAWYGFRAKSAEDVTIFRETYISIKYLTEGKL